MTKHNELNKTKDRKTTVAPDHGRFQGQRWTLGQRLVSTAQSLQQTAPWPVHGAAVATVRLTVKS